MATAPARQPHGPAPRPFTIALDDGVLLDLKRRLDATRWPDETAGPDWAFGTDLRYLRALVDYWRTGYDWRAQEAMLNRFHHFTAPIDGIDLHFIHEHGEGQAPAAAPHPWLAGLCRRIPRAHPAADASHGPRRRRSRRVHGDRTIDPGLRLFVFTQPAPVRPAGNRRYLPAAHDRRARLRAIRGARS